MGRAAQGREGEHAAWEPTDVERQTYQAGPGTPPAGFWGE